MQRGYAQNFLDQRMQYALLMNTEIEGKAVTHCCQRTAVLLVLIQIFFSHGGTVFLG